MKKVKIPLFFLLFSFSIQSQTGNQPLLLKDIVEKKYASEALSEMQQTADGEHYTTLSADGKAILKYAYKTGRLTDTLFHVDKVRETRLERIDGYAVDSRGYRILVWNEKEPVYRRSWQAKVYDYDVRRNFLKPLSDTDGKVMVPTFSPDGRMVAFVRDRNIWLKKLDYDTESPVTKDGAPGRILNGIADWVYEEEFMQTNLMSWSADSRFLAFLKSDETEVPAFTFQVFDGSLYPGACSYKYPKAGQNNSKMACFVFNIETKDTKQMNIPLDEDGYIPCIRFTENPDQLAVMTLNRHQNHFNMYFANPKSTVSKLVFHDESEYYIDSHRMLSIAFSPTHFACVSERDGFAHIYLYSMTGVLEKQVTSGDWDVTRLYGFDPGTKTVYYQSAEESPLRRSVYKVDAKGNKTKLSTRTGTNQAAFSPGFRYFVNSFSNTETPLFVSVHDEKGKELAVLTDNSALRARLAAVRFSQKTFFTFSNETGEVLNGWMIKPSSFNENKPYPAVLIQYSGPDSQEVLDKYNLDWYYYLAEKGYVVVSVDGRGTGARGEAFRKCTYLRLGLLESDDQIAAAKYLSQQPFVDKNRIAIWGWSYGGFITLMSMSRGNGIFHAGIAIAPLVDWRFYDSVYTERFMRTPQENFANYDLCSPLKMAGRLQGNLLLVHGTADDNVHYQNALYYSEALVEAGKNFEMQIYSNKNHSLPDTKTRNHLYTRILHFLDKQLPASGN
ncbi:MAG: S9 family peptidase [Dysgonamonadaceae bacterium]|jgi:dipeptidyl-peptidase-4|nr:S9 family peptidase [Dysgonamonadaceae bacterium]